MTIINGTTGNDSLDGTADADSIYGLAGNDLIYGWGGKDLLDGSTGNDSMHSGAGDDVLVGGDGADSLAGGDGNDRLNGGAGDDLLYVEAGFDTLTGGDGSDSYRLSGGTRLGVITDFKAGNGGDKIILVSGAFVNSSYFYPAVYQLQQSGADTLLQVDMDGTLGNGGFATALILRGVNKDSLTAFNFNGMDPAPILGTYEADTLAGNAGDNGIYGRAGNDTLQGLAGNDSLLGEAGDDSLDGGAGNDSLTGDQGMDILAGGTGNDTLLGGDDNDKLMGGSGQDYLKGGPGRDTLTGGTGSDIFEIFGGSVGPAIDPSRDIITDFEVGTGGDQLVLERTGRGAFAEDPFISGYVRLRQSGADTWIEYDEDGPHGDVRIEVMAILRNVNKTDLVAFNFQGINPHVLTGSAAADNLAGTYAAETILGLGGKDTLAGGAGNDTLQGGAGADYLTGGQGADHFVYLSPDDSRQYLVDKDHITDFNGAEGDRIDLSAMDANTTLSGNQAFSFISSSSFTGAGQLRYNASNGMLYGNINADTYADFAIQLVGNPAFDAAFLIA